MRLGPSYATKFIKCNLNRADFRSTRLLKMNGIDFRPNFENSISKRAKLPKNFRELFQNLEESEPLVDVEKVFVYKNIKALENSR